MSRVLRRFYFPTKMILASHSDCNNSFTSWLYSKLIFSNQSRVQQVSSNGNVFLLHSAVMFALLTAQCPAPPVRPVCNNWSFSINCWRPGDRRPEKHRIASLAKLTAISQVVRCVPIVPCGLTYSKGEAISFSSKIC